MRAAACAYDEALLKFRRRYLLAALVRSSGNQCRAAAEVGVHRNTLGRHLEECGITSRNWKELAREVIK